MHATYHCPRHLPGVCSGSEEEEQRAAPQPLTHHMLHADADLAIAVEGPVEAHNVWGVALVQHLQLPDDLVPDGGFDLQVN